MAPPSTTGAGSPDNATGTNRGYEYVNEKLASENILATSLHDMLLKIELCDVTVVASGGGATPGAAKKARIEREICAHRNVLAAASPYFRRLFSSGFDDATSARARIQDIDGDLLYNIVLYMYTGRITIDESNVVELLHHSEFLLMTDLNEACVRHLVSALSVCNCFSYLEVSARYNCLDLEKAACQFAVRNFGKMIESGATLTLAEDQFVHLISADRLRVNGEEEIYKAVISWVIHDKARRKKALHRLLGLVRLPCLSKEFLLTVVGTEPLIKGDAKCKDIYVNALQFTVASQCADDSIVNQYDYESWSRERQFNCFTFPTKKRQWLEAPKMLHKRKWFGATSMGGKLFAVGGHNGDEYLNSGEVFDPLTEEWIMMAALPEIRYCSALCDVGGLLYCVGGFTEQNVLIYNCKCNAWTSGPSTINERASGAASMGNVIYAAGEATQKSYSNSVEMWDPRTPAWQLTTPMLTSRYRPRLVSAGGRLYAIGGDEAQRVSVEWYDARACVWWKGADVIEEYRMGATVTSVNDRLIVAVEKDYWNTGNMVKMMSKCGGSWEDVAEMPPRDKYTFCQTEQCVFALGGVMPFDNDSVVSDSVACLALA